MTVRAEMIGKKFGKLTILALSEEKGSRGQLKYVCLCDCGRIKTILGESIRSKKTVSCGCEQRQRAREKNTTHGGCYDKLYTVWQGMKDRCQNPSSQEFNHYGGRGIKVCDEWQDYAKFREFMLTHGYDPQAPKGECTLERIDVNGNYEPSNCTVIPMSKQQYNKTNNHRLTFNGETKTVTEWEQELGFTKNLLFSRLAKGMSTEEALNTPMRQVRQYTVDGETHTCKEWAAMLDMPWSTLRNQLNKYGKTMEQAVRDRRRILSTKN